MCRWRSSFSQLSCNPQPRSLNGGFRANVPSTRSGLASFVSFARGVEADRAAVEAALSLPWSTGPVEGHVHRVKLLKRRGYGRAKLDLLRRLVLAREDRCLSPAITVAGRPGREPIPA
jgi:Transposase